MDQQNYFHFLVSFHLGLESQITKEPSLDYMSDSRISPLRPGLQILFNSVSVFLETHPPLQFAPPSVYTYYISPSSSAISLILNLPTLLVKFCIYRAINPWIHNVDIDFQFLRCPLCWILSARKRSVFLGLLLPKIFS